MGGLPYKDMSASIFRSNLLHEGEGGRRPDEGAAVQIYQQFPLTLTLSLRERELNKIHADFVPISRCATVFRTQV
jgi:hypothetical protein